MKRSLIKRAAAILICTASLLSLCSCTFINTVTLNFVAEDEKADFVMDKVDDNMSKADSYSCDMSGSFIAVLDGKEFRVTANSNEVMVRLKNDEIIHQISSEQIVNYDSGSQTMVSYTSEGYQSGKMYKTSDADGRKQKIWSEISARDYAKHIEDMNDSDLPEEDDAKTKTFKKEDGEIILIYKDFTPSSIRSFSGTISETLSLFGDGYELSDIEMTVTVNDKFYPEEISVELIIESSSDTEAEPLTFTIAATYSDINKTKAPDPLNLTEFTEVEDIRVLDKFNKDYEDFQSSDEGEFKLNLHQEITMDGNPESSGGRNIYNVSFEHNDGNCEYTIETTQSGYGVIIKYADGKEETSVKLADEKIETVSNTDKTQSEALQTLKSLMNPTSFSENDVIGIEINPDNPDKITLYLDIGAEEAYEAVAEQYNGVLRSVVCTVKIQYKDGDLHRVDTAIEAYIDLIEETYSIEIIVDETYNLTIY